MDNYSVPEQLSINGNLMSIEEFNSYRHVQDEPADEIASLIFDFSKYWAEKHLNENKSYDEYAREAKKQIHLQEQAYHFFDVIEKAINDPKAPGTEPYRYSWPQEAIELGKAYKEDPNTIYFDKDPIEILDRYFDDTRPEVLDPFDFLFEPEVQKVLERCSTVLTGFGPSVIGVLAVRSLLKQYAAFNSSNVLVSTKFLARYPHRRIFETMQFLIDVVTPGNLKKDGKGILAIKKLRLVHALVRHRIAISDPSINRKFTSWNEDAWGKPINQQDMILAIHTFSIEVIRGLQKVGYLLDIHEHTHVRQINSETDRSSVKDDFYLAWHYIGKALGIKDEINPRNYEEGYEMQKFLYHTQFRMGVKKEEMAEHPNLASPVLAEPLVNFIAELLPFTNRRKDALAVIAFYNDEEDFDPIFRDILGLDVKGLASTTFRDFLSGSLSLFDWFVGVLDKFSFRGKMGQRHVIRDVGGINQAFFIRLRNMSADWKGSTFTLRDGLDNKRGAREALMRNQQKLKSIFYYFITFIVFPVLFVVFGPISWFMKKRIAKYGRKHPRPDYNDRGELRNNMKEFYEEYKREIQNGQILIDDDLIEMSELVFEEV